jgi:hypothetical protein
MAAVAAWAGPLVVHSYILFFLLFNTCSWSVVLILPNSRERVVYMVMKAVVI